MLVLRWSASLLKKRRASPAGEPAGPDTTTLGEWYANDFNLGRRRYVLFLNAASRAALIVEASPASGLLDRFRGQLGGLLFTLGVSDEAIRKEIDATREVTIARTVDRSVVGSMVQVVKDLSITSRADDLRTGSALDELAVDFAFYIHLPLGSTHPADIVRARFGLPPAGAFALVEPPAGSIQVRRIHERDWEFSFPHIEAGTIAWLYEAIERALAGSVHGPRLMLERIVRENPECIEALGGLAHIHAERYGNHRSLALWRHAVGIGRRAIPPAFRIGQDRLPWDLNGNRAFLRACAGLAITLVRTGAADEAEALYAEMLALNPDDNLGARQMLVDLRLKRGDNDGALEVCDAYHDDASESLRYGRVLALYRLGRREEAREELVAAARDLPLVAQEIARASHLPPEGLNPYRVTHDSAGQAFIYWMRAGEAWAQTPGAIEFVASFLTESRGSTTAGRPARRTGNVIPLHGHRATDSPMGEFLSDEQVKVVAAKLRRALVESLPGADDALAGGFTTDSIRYQQLGDRVRQTREATGLSIKDVAAKLKVPKYRLSAVEDSFPRSIKPDIFWKYCQFLDLEAFARRWIEANEELATSLGIAQPRERQ